MKRARKPKTVVNLAAVTRGGEVYVYSDWLELQDAKRLHAWLGRYLKWANARKKK